jgi:hypothetical protein
MSKKREKRAEKYREQLWNGFALAMAARIIGRIRHAYAHGDPFMKLEAAELALLALVEINRPSNMPEALKQTITDCMEQILADQLRAHALAAAPPEGTA